MLGLVRVKHRTILSVGSALQMSPFDHPPKLTADVDSHTGQAVFYTSATTCLGPVSFDLDNHLQLLRYLFVYNYLSFHGSQKSLS